MSGGFNDRLRTDMHLAQELDVQAITTAVCSKAPSLPMTHDNQIDISYSLYNTASLPMSSTSTTSIYILIIHKHCCTLPTYSVLVNPHSPSDSDGIRTLGLCHAPSRAEPLSAIRSHLTLLINSEPVT